MREFLALGLTIVVISLFALAMRLRRRGRTPPPFLPEPTVSETGESTSASFDGVKSVAKAGTSRELRTLEIHERVQTGLCLYCERPASRQVPQVRQIRSVLDPLHRWLNWVAFNRYAIDLEPPIEIPHSVCEQHHSIARSHIERHLADNQSDYAAAVERKHNEMYEFTNYSLDERMLADANQVRRGKRPKTPLAEVRGITSGKSEKAAAG